ncbi:Isotrichodermin C-15 hydroxylase [Sphaceloma murrayae]|uniref:Isotrichodermin C-15 hydroxylase n=1 Tax=Sphaceloma murrayae TaxID=2082308 RepID=A0A2K1QKE8_9PEZI|nr:Isotrichodermin C-15 hydroxylase [Sphaceloma murrayae]
MDMPTPEMVKMSLAQQQTLWIFAIAGFALLVKVVHLLRNKLNHIPGPWHVKFTGVVLKYHTVSGRRLHYIHDLHKRYGPVVRMSPTEVDISDLKGFQDIHKIGAGFLKDKWYQKFRPGKTQDTFSVIDANNTSLRQNWEQAVTEKVKLTVSRMKAEAMQGNSDVFQWWTLMTTDVIGLLAFGESFKMVETGMRTPFIHDLEMATKLGGVRAELGLIYKAGKILSLGFWTTLEDIETRIQEYGAVVVANARDRTLGKANIFNSVLEDSKKEEDDMGFSDYAAAFEASGLVVAGSGTTAVTLTYLVWAVLRQPSVQHRLEEEVAALDDGFGDAELEQLPYLNAVIQEALRLYGAAPGSLPRVVPQTGLTVQGYQIPPGTTVCTQAYTIHRDASTFEDPERFNPDRFLIPQTPAQKAAMCAFGAGSRSCLGIHLANMEMRHGVAYFFRECAGATLARNMNDGVMEILNFFLISPKGARCEITMT